MGRLWWLCIAAAAVAVVVEAAHSSRSMFVGLMVLFVWERLALTVQRSVVEDYEGLRLRGRRFWLRILLWEGIATWVVAHQGQLVLPRYFASHLGCMLMCLLIDCILQNAERYAIEDGWVKALFIVSKL